MNQERVLTEDRARRFGWPWRRHPAGVSGARLRDDRATGEDTQPRQARFAWFGRSAGRSRSGPDAQVPALRLARDWLLASGGTLREDGPDLVAGALPDGAAVRYTTSVQRARRDGTTTLLAAGSPGLDALLVNIAAAGTGLTLRVQAGPTSAEKLARTACLASSDQSEALVAGAAASPLDAACDACCPVPGHYLVVGARKSAREARVLRRWEGTEVEYTFHVSTTSPRGRREELMRLGVDLATGERREPLSDAALVTARAASTDPALLAGAGGTLARAQALLEPAIQAAARLARVQVLPEYQRRQEEITSRAKHLIAERPDAGVDVLAMRERDLHRLAESHAVEVDVRLVAVATLLSPRAAVRVRLAGGGEVTVEVDLARATVAAPRCDVCGAAWQVGARCGEGHVTCLHCQVRCGHCGERQCSRCSSAAFTPCSTCSEPACATCLRTAARGRHRVRARTLRGDDLRRGRDAARIAGGDDGAGGPSENLRLADLDAMTPATWRACLEWMLASYGYTVERDLRSDSAEPALLCRRTSLDTSVRLWTDAAPAPVLVALGCRPAGRAAVGEAALARLVALGQEVPGARRLLITTGRLTREVPAARTRGVDVLDRDRLGSLLVELATAYGRERDKAERETALRAQAASAVRTTLMNGLPEAAALARRASTASARRVPKDSTDREVAPVRDGAQVARQALTALETLVEEWEAAFTASATRAGTQEFAASVAGLEGMNARAIHLLDVLRQGCEQIGAVSSYRERTSSDWHQDIVEEVQRHCVALALRCESHDPAAWRAFEAVRDRATAERSVEELGSSRRAAARARRRWDEHDVRERATALPERRPRG
jgi:hypothetical protein